MEYYGYSNPWGLALQQPLGGLMSPFTTWGLGAMNEPVQPQEPTTPQNQRVTGEGGYGQGYSPNDGQVADRGPTTPNDISARQEMMGALRGYGLNAAKNTAIDTAAAYAGGFAPTAGQIAGRAVSNLAHPGAVMGLAGDVIGQQTGMTAPAGVFGKVARPAITGLLSLVNPALGIAYGLMSPMAMDALGDMTNTRNDEDYKDAFEENHGYFGGRLTSKEIGNFAERAGFDSLGSAYANQGYGPKDAARGMSNKDATSMARGGNPMGNTYGANRGGGFSNAVGGPKGGARSVDSAYGPNMGGFAGLGIGNPSSYGGKSSGGGGKSSGGSGGRSSGGGIGAGNSPGSGSEDGHH